MDAVDEVGCSALHLCAEHGYYRMIKLLLEVGFGTRLQKSRIDPNFSSLCEDSSLTAVEVANSTGCLRLEDAGRTGRCWEDADSGESPLSTGLFGDIWQAKGPPENPRPLSSRSSIRL